MFEEPIAEEPSVGAVTGAADRSQPALLAPSVLAWPADREDDPFALRELWDAVAAAERAAAVAFLAQLDAMLALYDANRRGEGNWHGLDDLQLVAEVGMLANLSEFSVERRLTHALTVRDVPLLRTLLLAGRLGVTHAVAAIDEVADYGPEVRERVLQDVLHRSDEPGWDDTPSRLVRALRRRVQVVDPAGCEQRRRARLAAQTGVRLKALADGLAKLTATGDAVTVRAAHTLLHHLAVATGPDDDRTPGQRQLDALCQALAGAAGTGVVGELQLEVPVEPAAPAAVPEPGVTLDPVVVRHDLTGELLALLSGTPLPSAADVAAAEEEQGEPEPEETGQPVGRQRRRPREGVAELEGVGPVDRGLLRDLLGPEAQRRGLPRPLTGLTVRRLCVDPTGQVIAADPVAVPLARLLARSTEPGASPTPHRLLRALVSGLPAPPPDTAAYRPTAAQKRVVRARDTCCTFPGCGRPARTSELDHRVPYPDGATSTDNLHPLCKHHHDLKHAGFRPTRHPDGSTTWVSPHGHRARVRPD